MKTKISNSILSATFNTKGAELIALNSKNKNYIWNGNPDFWGKHSPILFPIVGTLKNNIFSFEGNQYNLNRHGFARDLDFEIVSQTTESIVFSLKSNAQTILNYPFEFELQIAYHLSENKLNVGYKVINKSKKIMPFSIGGHPAFALNKPFENYSLVFSNNENPTYYLLENDLISKKNEVLKLENKTLNLNYKLFENDALVFKTIQFQSITILEKAKPFLKLNFEGFPDFGIWTKPNAPFICLEPWFGYSDSSKSNHNIYEKEGIQLLNPNAVFKSNYNIEIL